MASVLQLRLVGGASNSTPEDSLGGIMSSNQVSATAMNNLFDNITADQASAGHVDYRAVDLYNAGDATAESVVFFIDSETTSEDTALDIGHDATNNPHVAVWDGETIVNETTAPSAPVITFNHTLTGNKLSIPDIPVGEAARIWIRRTCVAGAENIAGDSARFACQYA